MPTGYWANFRKFIVSLLKAWYGDAATPENDFGFSWLPRLDADYSQLPYFDRMSQGRGEGLLPLRAEPRRRRAQRAACTARDCAISTGWWCSTGSRSRAPSSGRTIRRARRRRTIKTEVFFIPAAAAPEKEGSLTNTQRMLQWHDKALDPLGDSRSDAWFLYNLGKRLKQLYAGSTDPRDQPLLHLTWDYELRPAASGCPTGRLSRIEGEPDLEKVLMEINGYRLTRSTPAPAGRGSCRGSPSWRTTARPRAAAGSTAACSPSRAATARGSASSAPTRSSPSGASPGRTTAACSTTAPRPTPTGARGRSGRSWSGGTREQRRWVGDDEPDFDARAAARLPPAARRHGHGRDRGRPAVHHEARRRGLALRAGQRARTARCPRTTSRSSRRSATCSTRRQPTQPDGAALRGAAQPRWPTPRPRSTRSSRPRSASPSTT